MTDLLAFPLQCLARVMTATWNVAGRSPPSDLDVESWLGATTEEELADIYVIGFQEVVPLNAGNVLGGEHEGAATIKWDNLISRALNRSKSPILPPAASHHRRSISVDRVNLALVADQPITLPPAAAAPPSSSWKSKRRSSKKRNMVVMPTNGDGWFATALSDEDEAALPSQQGTRYLRIASKQMVGIFISVWARAGIQPAIRNIKVSCVGCGLMGYLGNKGSIAVSLSVHETSFCFVCSHLTSGEREGDELRRNADVTEILRRTCFHRPKLTWPEMPETIMGHDRIIWLGDLNYRIALPDAQTRLLISRRDWQTLLRRDQLRTEKMAGRVFDGWQEGCIEFPPTYKYVINSDRYSGLLLKAGEKRRTPAWCDRILWYGKGLRQLEYRRSESRFSDHRPVSAVFLAEVDVLEDSKLKRLWSFSKANENLLAFTEPSMGLGNQQQSNDSEVRGSIPSSRCSLFSAALSSFLAGCIGHTCVLRFKTIDRQNKLVPSGSEDRSAHSFTRSRLVHSSLFLLSMKGSLTEPESNVKYSQEFRGSSLFRGKICFSLAAYNILVICSTAILHK
ncbi:hypothetical protein SELMODRAFT_97137 [Selaginella moellendorffii]|uniref:Uncharacterized protein IP5P2-1 n=1 Tax=Selaginella moellendorffii TaxID=88036 RepID=D8RMI0_SELML|nr:hypothetical protein SELMODRAFT_97137 [Selaginella moellendorffii]